MTDLREWAQSILSTRDEKEVVRQLKRLIGFVKEGEEIWESEPPCSFCDEPLPNGNIPACKRPTTKKVRIPFVGDPKIYDVCDHHFSKMSECGPGEATKLFPLSMESTDDDFKRLAPYFYTNDIREYRCKGCGSPIVRQSSRGFLSDGAGPLDVMVAMDHLNTCPWRRTEMEKDSRKASAR